MKFFLNHLKKSEVFISSILIILSIFFFDNKLIGFNKSKFLILLLLPFFFINFNLINIQKFKKFLIIYFLCSIILLIHSGYSINFEYKSYNILSFIYLSFLFLICLNLTNNFDEIINKSVNLFILISNFIFFLSIVTELNEYVLYDHKEFHNGLCIILYNENGSLWNYLFIENSHYGMIATGIIAYQLYNFEKLSLSKKLNFIFFITMSYLFITSLTLYLGILISSVLWLFFIKVNKVILFKSFLIISLNIILILNLDNCFHRIAQVKYAENMYLDNKQNNIVQFFGKNKKKNTPETDIIINSTTAVHINHINFSLDVLKKNILGVGFQNYGIFSYRYAIENKLIDLQRDMAFMNIGDGASTFNKLLAEFGLINIIFIFLFIYSSLKTNLNDGSKILLISIICTQLIRGAGYFNGGFIFFSLILFLSSCFFYRKN